MKLSDYRSFVFDCDGVILNSNSIKTDAFRFATSAFGEKASQSLVDFHKTRGGVSRYEKFNYFLNNIVPLNPSSACMNGLAFDEKMNILLLNYSRFVKEKLMVCACTNALPALGEKFPLSTFFVVSGSDQKELREIFEARGLNSFFGGGIFGSPDTKHLILSREVEKGNLLFPALFIGDSYYDYEAARDHGLDFVFVHQWTEMPQWRDFVAENNIFSLPSICSLLDLDQVY